MNSNGYYEEGEILCLPIKEDINSRTVWFGTFIFVFVETERFG